ncbi:SDR family oxidoreductase [Nocardiopsis flavescens]|uniref:SDR family oxidoreductase n=1 Tax=Nocardiopsis flavescens TaxID=758803 RepID=UPI00365F6A0E
MTDLSGKVAVATSSSRGIGSAIVQRYAWLGASVVIAYSTDEDGALHTLEEVEAAGGRGIVVRADVASPAGLDALYATAVDTFGRLDIVVANAGEEVADRPVAEVTEEQFDRLFAVNAKGAFFALQKAARLVSDGGRLIYVGSGTTAGPRPGTGLYSSSKRVAEHLVRVLAMELSPRNVTVNTILPAVALGAGVPTGAAAGGGFHHTARFPPPGGRGDGPEDVADAAEYLAGELAGRVSGQSLLVSGGAPR